MRFSNPKRGACVVAALALLAAPAGAQQGRPLQPADYYRMVEVEDPAVSPEGDLLAFTVIRPVEAENRRHRTIWIQELQNGDPRGEPMRLTAPDEDSHSPRWSPDGSLLSFVSHRDGDPNPVWFVRIGGVGGEAFHVEGVEGPPVWSPDGEWIAYLRAPRSEKGGAGRIAPDALTLTADSSRFDGRVVTHLPFTEEGSEGYLPHPSVATRRQLFVVPAEGGEPTRVTSTEMEIADPAWGEDGDRIYFTGGRHLDRFHDREADAAVWTVPRDGGDLLQITGAVGFQWSPEVAPDGDRIAYLSAAGPSGEVELEVAELHRSGTLAEEPATLTASFDRDPEAPGWGPGGEIVHFGARDGGARHLFRVSVEGGAVEPVTAGPRTLEGFSFSGDGRVLAYVASDAQSPPEVHVARGDGTVAERATAFNDGWREETTLSSVDRVTWTTGDSTEIEGWLLPPTSVRPEGGHPLVLTLRHDRFGASGHHFRPLHQILAGAGFYVFYTNPRGASGYGEEFRAAIQEAWGMTEKDDLVAGLDTVLSRYTQAAADRVGVVGHGYGGFLAGWLTATSDRFAAAVVSAPAVDWQSWFGTSEARSLVESELDAVPWRARSVYRRVSPISYVENVTAPTLVLLGEADRRYPPAEAEKWFVSLQRRGVPTELVRYPGASHDLPRTGRPWQVVDRLERIRSWLDHWLVEQPEGTRVSEGAGG